jgi:micrococcal nuclease
MSRSFLIPCAALLLLAAPSCKKEPADSGSTPAPNPVGAPPQAEPTPHGESPETGDEGGDDGADEPLDDRWPTISLNGVATSVRWSDGDSFKFKSGVYAGKGVRLVGYNTLESYGPVHRWGTWTAVELYRIAKSSWKLGASQSWECTTDGDQDHYGRVLVDCPGAALHLVGEGHAFVFSLGDAPPPELLEAQRAAMKEGRGIWAKGSPREVISSLHSADEGGSDGKTYNRIVDTETGIAREAEHADTYSVCQEVCLGGDSGSCMTYVPFATRYKNKSECLIVKDGE